ncbi:unnamed protein product, partial [Polarella glacialis]
MFRGCCCVAAQDPHQLSFTLATDERVSYRPSDGPPGAARVPLTSSPRMNRETPFAPDPDAQLSARSALSLSADEKEKEKARLQALVNSFIKKAVRGYPCVYLREGSAERIETQYRIDKNLEYLIVVSLKDSAQAEVTCPISMIQDIYCFAEDGASCFPPEVVEALWPGEPELLLMVVFANNDGKLYRFCILAESKATRDEFLECI